MITKYSRLMTAMIDWLVELIVKLEFVECGLTWFVSSTLPTALGSPHIPKHCPTVILFACIIDFSFIFYTIVRARAHLSSRQSRVMLFICEVTDIATALVNGLPFCNRTNQVVHFSCIMWRYILLSGGGGRIRECELHSKRKNIKLFWLLTQL